MSGILRDLGPSGDVKIREFSFVHLGFVPLGFGSLTMGYGP